MKTEETKTPVIHYHRDTEELAAQLVKETIYDTSKGKARFKMRSQSNGKLMFFDVESKKNVYFTKQEWIDGDNSIKKIIADFKVEAVIPNSMNSVRKVTEGLVRTKSILTDISPKGDPFSGQEALYIDNTHIHGIKVRYDDSGKTVTYFLPDEFKKRFKVKSVGSLTAKEAAALDKPSTEKVVKKAKRKR